MNQLTISITTLLLMIASTKTTADPIDGNTISPYAATAALFGPQRHFICNAVLLARGKVLTTADCLNLASNGSIALGQPQDFHLAVETASIETFETGAAFAKPARDRLLAKLAGARGEKFDNKHSNGVFSNQLSPEEKEYVLKRLDVKEFGSKQSDAFLAVSNISVHPRYEGNFSYDVAVLKIPRLYPRNASSLVKGNINLNGASAYNQVVQIYGWGTNDIQSKMSSQIQTVEMYILPPIRCEQVIGAIYNRSQHICLWPKLNRTVCFGFAGAPIVLNGRLIGLIEFGDSECSSQSPVVGLQLDAFAKFLELEPPSLLEWIRTGMRSILTRITGVFL